MAKRRILYTAAHGGFAGLGVPLGGGAAISEWLCEEWCGRRDIELDFITPQVLGPHAPTGRDIARFDERAYARFCLAFSRASTQRILERDPSDSAVLVNDISEAPDFARLATAGFRMVTIYHVDVVDYIASIYLRGKVSASTLARAWQFLRPIAEPVSPSILKLIFERQRDSLIHSHRVVVPSERMKSILLDAYPATPSGRIEVVPWGVHAETTPEAAIETELAALRSRFNLEPGGPVILCLSRISPEKGQDLLLAGLLELERQGAFCGNTGNTPAVLICGEPAFMRGRPHMELLRRLAARLRRVRVHFPGHVIGARKVAMFRAARVYAFPSRHESYGLTLAESLAHGLPSVAFDRPGTAEILRDGQGVLVAPGAGSAARFVSETIALLEDPVRRARLSTAATAWACAHPFSRSASRVAALLDAGADSGG